MVPITLTDRAANKVRTLLTAQQADGYGLRIDVDLGGCAGYSYKLALAPQASEDEAVVPQDGFDVFVPHAVAPLLEGIRIDYVDTIASSGPNRTSNTPPLASKQDEYRIVSSVPRKSDRAASSCLCSTWVPQMNRTLAIPKPHSRSAAAAASSTCGLSASPR